MPDPIEFLYTTEDGPGYAAAQPTPSASLGGFASTTAWAGGVLGDLFGMASSLDVANARPDHRCLYAYNPSFTDTLVDVRAYVSPATAGAGSSGIGVDPRPVTYVDSTAAQAVEPGSAYTAPPGVSFSSPADFASAVVLGDLPPRAGRALWVRRVPVDDSDDAAAESLDLTVSDGGANAAVRRVSWVTEPAAEPSAPFRFPRFAPTPTPFRRVMVDFITGGGSRITWELDRTLVDDGPYDYQLQASQSGVVPGEDEEAESDWADVGPPVRDATFLLDPDRRLWGVSPTLHYRVVLTTAAETYVSGAANVYGLLTKEQWLVVREVYRKEDLNLRRFTGISGFLLKARRYGTVCPACTDPVTREVGNSSCPTCYGTGFSGGYHPPVPYSVVDLGNESYKEKIAYNDGTGTVSDRAVVKGRALARLPVVTRDAWVAVGSDRRYHVHRVGVAAARLGVPVVFDVELHLAPRSDVLYAFPIERPDDDPPFWEETEVINV